jgi:D-alanyl-D-alanine carboxypeptidase
LNRAGFSRKPHNSSNDPEDDIPAALRDTPDAAPMRLQLWILLVGGISVFVLLSIVSGFIFFLTAPKQTTVSQPLLANSATPASGNSANQQSNGNTLLGHITYPEAPQTELAPISANGRITMRKTAAQKLQEMVRAARSAGITLIPISGFRSVKDQEQLFFGVGAQRNQVPTERAALSAPPGYSEHHTGYAVDLGDGAVPATNLQTNFDNTKAYQWLQANAARFGFEMSFPKDNVQGVSYEPWHWRYVGDRDSLEMFYRAKNLKTDKVAQ